MNKEDFKDAVKNLEKYEENKKYEILGMFQVAKEYYDNLPYEDQIFIDDKVEDIGIELTEVVDHSGCMDSGGCGYSCPWWNTMVQEEGWN